MIWAKDKIFLIIQSHSLCSYLKRKDSFGTLSFDYFLANHKYHIQCISFDIWLHPVQPQPSCLWGLQRHRVKFPKLEKRLSEMNFSLHSEWLCCNFPGEVARHLIDLHVQKILPSISVLGDFPPPLASVLCCRGCIQLPLCSYLWNLSWRLSVNLLSSRYSSGIRCHSHFQLAKPN